MAKRYTRINYQDSPSTATPLSAANLNKMDKGIDDIDNAIEEIYNKRVNNVVTTNPDTFLAGPVGKTLQDQITTLNNNLAKLNGKIVSDVNAINSYGFHLVSPSTLNTPEPVDGMVFQMALGEEFKAQLFFGLGANVVYHRTCYGTWRTWKKISTT